MKKLMLLAAMLAMVMAAAIPALAQNIEPAPGDVEPAPGYGDVEPAPGNVDSGDCSEALEDSVIIRRASKPSPAPDGTSVVPAEEPGCFAIPVPAPADGSS